MNKYVAVLFVLTITLLMSSCSSDKSAQASDANNKSFSQSSVSSDVKQNATNPKINTLQINTPEEEKSQAIDFGKNTIFDGIGIASDDNGEIECLNKDEALWYKLDDKRFNSLKELRSFVYNSLGDKKGAAVMKKIKYYFAERDDGLYLVSGINERGIDNYKNYFTSGGGANGTEFSDMLIVSVKQNRSCTAKTGIVRSHIEFVKEKGRWKLNNLTLFF